MTRKRLGEILLDAELITENDLQRGLREQQRWGGPLGKVLVAEKIVDETILIRALAKQLKLPVVSLTGLIIDEKIKDLVDLELIERYEILPYHLEGKFLDVATNDPLNMGVLDELQILTRLNIRPHIATSTDIAEAIQKNYSYKELTIGGVDSLYGNHVDDFDFDGDAAQGRGVGVGIGRVRPDAERQAEITALQKRVAALESRIVRDENIIRKMMGLLIQNGGASREQMLEILK